MAQRSHTEAELREIVELVEECLKEGYAPPDVSGGKKALAEASRRAVERGIGASASTFRSRYDKACISYREPDWSLYRAPQYQAPKGSRARPAPAMHPVNTDAATPEEGDKLRVMVIGDCHDDPRLADYDRFRALGAYAARMQPDRIVQIGDWSTFDSVSRHEDRSTISGRALPSFEDDMGSLRMSLRAFHEGLGGFSCPKHITLGNHEDRVRQYENLNATLEGAMYLRVVEAFEQYEWQSRPYGEWLFLGGVGFTHVPLNIMGRPYGGKTLNPICNDAVFSIVFGHSHKGGLVRAPKIGPNRRVTILNVGCSLPEGHVEDYAKLSTTGWEYGVYDVTIAGGDIQSAKHHTMSEVMGAYAEPA